MEQEPQIGLVPLRNELQIRGKQSLTSSEIVLSRELDVTAANSKTDLPESLTAEIFRRFSRYQPAAIEWVFRAWRDRSQFFPTIFDLRKLMGEWIRNERERRDRQSRAEDRKQSPADCAEFIERLRNIAKMPLPPHMEKQREYRRRTEKMNYATPPIIRGPETPEQKAERDSRELAEIERYRLAEEATYSPKYGPER